MKKLLLGAAMIGATMLAGPVQAAGQERAPAMRGMQFPDPDGDGATTRDEMLAASDARFAALDTDKDGRLGAGEIGAAAAGGRMLRRADADGDGQVTREELRALAGRRFDRLDANRDGRIDKAEREAARGRMKMRGN